MKYLNEKKGFTLIELLAVIVILAIITVIGITTVLPYLRNAGKNAFAVEANAAIDAASQAMSLSQIGSISVSGSSRTEGTGNNAVTYTDYCFTLKNLVDLGLWTKDSGSVTDPDENDENVNAEYEGTIVVTQQAGSKAYTYSVSMHNSSYFVNGVSGNISDGNVSNYVKATNRSQLKLNCS